MDKSTSNRNRNEIISMVDSWKGVFKHIYIYSLCLQKAEKNITIMRKEFENVKNTQVELLEMKTAILKVENSLDEVFF